MALKKIKLPNNTTVDINDARNVVIGDGADNIVTLTNAEYQALETKDPNTVYIVTDVDPGGGGGGGGDGTVTSVAMTVPTGLSVSGSPITTSGTLAVSLATGYEIPQSSAIVHTTGNETIAGNKTFTGVTASDHIVLSGQGYIENTGVEGFGWIQDENADTLDDALSTKANDYDVVHKTGNESISGAKSFTGDVFISSSLNVASESEAALAADSAGFGWIVDDNGYSVQDALDAKGTYSKPSGGIPATDLASAVQTSLGKADTALQSYTETDPTVPSWAKEASKPSYTLDEVSDGSTRKLSNYVSLSGTETISGTKTFTGVPYLKFNNARMIFQAADGTVQGNIAMRSPGVLEMYDLTAYRTVYHSGNFIAGTNYQKPITISSSEPTSSQGSDGDIWIVI